MKIIYIYSLSDPDGNIRYIGKTINIKRRLYSHIAESKRNNNRYVLKWVKSLLDKGFKPIINIIEVCNESNWEEKEIYWIDYYKSIIHNLCNHCKGGKGGLTKDQLSIEQIQKKKEIMSNVFSKFNNTEKKIIWNMILNNKSQIEIQFVYPNYTRSIDFGVRNGRQWREITNLPIIHNNLKRKDYTCRNGLFMVRKNINGTIRVIFSSRKEQEVLNFLNK